MLYPFASIYVAGFYGNISPANWFMVSVYNYMNLNPHLSVYNCG